MLKAWFITDASYLPALNSHFNQISYKAHQAAELATELEGDLEALLSGFGERYPDINVEIIVDYSEAASPEDA